MNALVKRLKITEGERGVICACLVVAVFGAGVAHSVIGQLGGSETILRRVLSTYDIWIIVCGALGSLIALYIGRNWLGHPGVAGWSWAVTGIPVITFIAGICGGTLALPFYGTMFGPFSILMTFIGNPILGLLWVTTLLAAHRLIFIWREERDSIFRTPIGNELAA